jgi:hypothetical protein
MAAANSIPFPVYGQPYRAQFEVYNSTTGLLITTGTGTLAAVISKDNSANASTTNNPVEAPADSGYVYVDLTAAEMSANCVRVYLTSSTSDAVAVVQKFFPLMLQPGNGQALGSNTWWEQSILRFERIIVETNAYQFAQNNTQAGAQEVYNTDGTPLAAGTLASTQMGCLRSLLS